MEATQSRDDFTAPPAASDLHRQLGRRTSAQLLTAVPRCATHRPCILLTFSSHAKPGYLPFVVGGLQPIACVISGHFPYMCFSSDISLGYHNFNVKMSEGNDQREKSYIRVHCLSPRGVTHRSAASFFSLPALP